MAKTGAEKLAAKAKRFSNRGTITGQFQAENLRKASINPMDAKMTTQERGGMALEAGAAAGAATSGSPYCRSTWWWFRCRQPPAKCQSQ